MRVALLLCIAASCASPGAAPTAPSTPAKSAATAQPSPDTILERTRDVYAKAKTYRDKGTSVMKFAGHENRKTFTTAFDRAGRFRFEYRDNGDPKRSHVIWTDNGMSHAVWFVRPDQLESHPDVGVPLGAAAGVSESLSMMIPPLLFETRAFLVRAPYTAASEVVVAGHPCWKLDAGDDVGRFSLFIDRDSALIRRVIMHRHIESSEVAPFDADQTVDFEPELDVTLADVDLRGPSTAGLAEHKADAPKWIGVLFETESNRVREVLPDSPAAKAGVQAGDTIVALGGGTVASAADVIRTVQSHASGDALEIVVDRRGAQTKAQLVIEYRPNLEKVQHNKLVDKPAPAFKLSTLAGGSVSLTALKGKVVVIDFWATWCGPCIASFPAFAKLHESLGKKGVVIVGITDDELDAVKDTVAEHKLPYTIALDTKREAWRDFLVQGLPTTVVVDKAGVVRYVTVGTGDAEEQALATTVQKLLK